MLRSLGDPALCHGHASRDFVDIDFHFFIKSCLQEFAAAVFYNDSCLFLLTFSLMSQLTLLHRFGITWFAQYFLNSPFDPRGELAGSSLRRFIYFCDRCFVACDPLGNLSGSTFKRWCDFGVEVSQLQNFR